jgi:ActR/RegA family two-component response regulator
MNARTTDILAAYRLLILDLVKTGAFTLGEFERASRFQFVKGHLELYGFNQCRAARALGIHRNTLNRILRAMEGSGIELERHKRKNSKSVAIFREKRSA